MIIATEGTEATENKEQLNRFNSVFSAISVARF